MTRGTQTPPAVLLGGVGSTLSVARSLGREGVRVHVLAPRGGALVGRSRYCTAVATPSGGEHPVESWLSWLEQSGPQGAVLLPTGDEGVELVVRHSERLRERGYRLLDYAGDTSLAMLDKARTYELARGAGIPCPRTWEVTDEAELVAVGGEIPFPCALKPVHSHLFAKHFPVKVLIARDADDLRESVARTLSLGLEMLITEIIPGPDHATWTYSSYIGDDGEPLFGLTRNKLRASPVQFGVNSYLVTRWRPDVAEAGLDFLRGVGLRGMVHVEFKRDPRDGVLKLIECNHRFVNVQELLRRAGLDVASFAYKRAAGLSTPPMDSWRDGVRLWFPLPDLRSAREYRRMGELTWPRWLRSLAHRRVYVPYLALDDPIPSVVNLFSKLRSGIGRN